MNYYERVQRAIDYIEDRLTDPIQLEKAAIEACLSLPHFYRMFHALTGHTVKEYIRNRRLSEAVRRLRSEDSRIIDLAFDYQYESQEAFTRAFKKVVGVTPGVYRKGQDASFSFPQMDLVDIYISPESSHVATDPRIKVLKQLSPMRIAWCRVISKTPERDAGRKLFDWAERAGLLVDDNPYRVFGFDNPSPTPGQSNYGYEMWITVGMDIRGDDDVHIKEFPGGLYAVTHTTVAEIHQAWQHFASWLKVSKYDAGIHQCLEEHLSPAGTPEESMQIDLYLPLTDKKHQAVETTSMSENKTRLLTDVRIEELPPYRVAFYRAEGKQPETKAWRVLYDWAKSKGLMDEGSGIRRFGFNNPNPSAGQAEYGYEVWVTVGDDVVESGDIRIKDFEGGRFAVLQTDLAQIGQQWQALVRWAKSSKYTCGSGQCLEEVMTPPGTPEDELVLDLYLPLAE